jgi:3-oxoacyl-[acyl-carrier protein] reductase
MDLGLEGKVAIVTAASQGLGKAVALGLAREGASVAMCSRSLDRITRAGEEVRAATGADVLALEADVAKAEDVDRLVEATVQRFGGVDILVCNAGGPPLGAFMEHDDRAWTNAFDLNFLSAVRLIRAVVPHMRRRGGGRIITMTSTAVKQPIEGLILSNSIRAGVIGLTKTLSQELAPDGILVNSVAPGRIRTERVVQVDSARAAREGRPVEEIAREQARQIPLGRYGEPEEFANAVVFLASAPASYITGVTLQVDGGLVRGLY